MWLAMAVVFVQFMLAKAITSIRGARSRMEELLISSAITVEFVLGAAHQCFSMFVALRLDGLTRLLASATSSLSVLVKGLKTQAHVVRVRWWRLSRPRRIVGRILLHGGGIWLGVGSGWIVSLLTGRAYGLVVAGACSMVYTYIIWIKTGGMRRL